MTVVMMSEQQAAPEVISLHRPNLLVIEDDPVTRALLGRLFADEYTVTSTANGTAGLQAIAQGNFDVILLDVMMPGLSGFDVLEQIRSSAETADLPVILVSGLTDNEHIVRGLQLGANDYLTKPINIHVARARLQTQVKLKRLLDEKNRAVQQFEQLSQLREQLLDIASHDLKAPLSNLNLAIQELNRFVPHTSETADLQDAIDMTLEQMQRLIEDFLDVGMLDNTALILSPHKLHIGDCLHQVASQYARAAARKRITLAVRDDSSIVEADHGRLLQVIGNLVSNAIKFSPQGATVHLWAEVVGDHVRVCVQDEGPGMDADEQSRLFMPFTSGRARPTGGESSTGLGLWIVGKLVALLNGSVGVESSPGNGSTFWIELPACHQNAA